MVVSFSTLFIGTANDMGIFIFSVWYAVYKETNMDIFEKIHLTKLKHKELKLVDYVFHMSTSLFIC